MNKKAKVREFRPIDDVFFEVLAQNPMVCQELLRTILEDGKLVGKSVITQSDERNIYGRSVRLDVLCQLGDGMQRYEKIAVQKERVEILQNMIQEKYTKESILRLGFTEDEYAEAEKELR